MIMLSCSGNDAYGPKVPWSICLLPVECIHPPKNQHTHVTSYTHTPHCSSLSSSTQECCYDGSGRLLTGSPGGGSLIKEPLAKSRARHFQEDVRPYLLCCTGYVPSCQKYYEHRPSDDGTRYQPQVPGKLFLISTYNKLHVLWTKRSQMVSFLIADHICLLHKQNSNAALCFHPQPVASLHEYGDVMVCEWD